MATKKDILKCIESEDKKNPYTDEIIADILDSSREIVTKLRKELSIPDSRERRKNELFRILQLLIEQNPDVSNRSLTKKLNDEQFIIGKYAVQKIREQIEGGNVNPKGKKTYFQNVVGTNGSLKNVIQQAIASVSYPPYGLDCCLIGNYGTGRAMIVHEMFQFAKSLDRVKEMQLYEIDCIDYLERPLELLACLFGQGDVLGAIENYNSGFIYIKNIQFFPPQGLETLYRYLDKKVFTRLNDNQTQRESHAFIVGSINAKNTSTIAREILRHFPMTIEIPTFIERPLHERVDLIKSSFIHESQKMDLDITVRRDVQLALVSQDYPENIKQLLAEIKVACAKAFVESKLNNKADLTIETRFLTEAFSTPKLTNDKDTSIWIRGDLVFVAGNEKVYSRTKLNENWDHYTKIEKRFTELKNAGIDNEEVEKLLSKEIEYSLSQQIRDVQKSKLSREEISMIAGEEILNLSQSIYDKAKLDLPYLDQSIVFPLAVHLKMLKDRRQYSKNTLTSELNEIKQNCPKEFLIAKNILDNVSRKFKLPYLQDEVGYLAIYFQKFQSNYNADSKKIAVLVVSHGHVASAMAEAANVIMGENHAHALDLEYEDTPRIMCDKVISKVKQIDEGKGTIILADMGSLLQVRAKIEQALNIHVGVLGRTDTLLVIECIRKTLWTQDSLDEIIRSIDSKETMNTYENQNIQHERPPAIITCCITGEGAAIHLENYLRQQFETVFRNIVWIHVGYIEQALIKNRLGEISKDYDVLACVGTLNPNLIDIPFFTAEEVYQSEGLKRLKQSLMNSTNLFNPLEEVLNDNCILIEKKLNTKEEVLDKIVHQLIKESYVTSDFLLSVYKREAFLPTYLKGGLAIPHGETQYITKSVIHITKLDKPICWDGENMVDFIFMIAIDEDHRMAFEELFQRVREPAFIDLLKSAKTSKEILSKFLDNTVLDK